MFSNNSILSPKVMIYWVYISNKCAMIYQVGIIVLQYSAVWSNLAVWFGLLVNKIWQSRFYLFGLPDSAVWVSPKLIIQKKLLPDSLEQSYHL